MQEHAAEETHQRARGELRLDFKARNGATVLDRLRQDGCLKARFPRLEVGGWSGAITLNSAGGVAGGDRLATSIGAGTGAAATVASQAAERFYRALPGSVSEVCTTISVQARAAIEWLPQETILFDECALRRRLAVDVAADGWFLGVESLVFGRTAMGEVVRRASIDDLVEIRRGGRLILHDRIKMEGNVAAALGRRAIGGGACAVATMVLVAFGAEARVGALRTALATFDAGASGWDGLLVARIVAKDGACLRAATVAGLAALREGRPLPRVWSC
ncbi:MAG: urease accessory protein UreD [Pseudomonadota bacterium]|nr:urease accessory protein UreD [Pseudomonadota bacterium]